MSTNKKSRVRKKTVHEVAFRLAFDMQTHMAGKVGDFGADLTPLKMRILRVVWSVSDASASDIVRVVRRDKAQVARLIDDLTAQGLLRREVDPADRRSKLLYLTERGEEIFNSVAKIEQAFAARIVKGIKSADLDTFYRVADQITENLGAL